MSTDPVQTTVPLALCTVHVVGERNSGTNFVAATVACNFADHVEPGVEPVWVHNLSRLLAPWSTGVEEVKDLYWSVRRVPYGWKHRDASSLRLDEVAAWSDVRLLAVVRDPFAWALSMHASPFHLGRVGAPAGQSLSAFLATAPAKTGRERRATSLDSMWALWSHKAHSLMQIEAAWNVSIVRYEDVVLNSQAVLERALLPLGVRRNDRPWEMIEGTARPWHRTAGRDLRTRRDFRKRVIDRSWMSAFGPEDLALAKDTLDPVVLGHFGYPAS